MSLFEPSIGCEEAHLEEEELRYKLEGRCFDSRYGQWLSPSGRTMALRSTQTLNANIGVFPLW